MCIVVVYCIAQKVTKVGEFKGRIIERAFRQSGGKTPLDVPLPDVFEVVEEMRKEFPKRYSVAHAPHWGDEEQNEREEFADEVVEWFKKHLGIKDYERKYWEYGYI